MTFPDLAALAAVLLVGVTLGVFLRRVEGHLQSLSLEQRSTNRLLAELVRVGEQPPAPQPQQVHPWR